MNDDLDLRPIDLLDPDQEGAARAWMDVHVSVQRDLFGDRGSEWTLEELQAFHRKGDKKRVDVAAWLGDELVGALEVQLPLLDNDRAAMLWLGVRPDVRGRGIGSMLLSEAERVGAANGRTSFFAETEWAEGGTDGAESFAARRGYSVGLTVLRSDMSLPVEASAMRALVEAPGARDYRLESFVDDMPEAWLEDRALLQQRMSTDAPMDDLEHEEEAWDDDRIRAQQASLRAGGRRIVECAARHVPTGRLVAYTQVTVTRGQHVGFQQDTLVLKEHRGHGLGLRLKAANALLLMDEVPEVTSIRTWNAASNEHMLAVNRRLGYRVDGYSREWQKQTGVTE